MEYPELSQCFRHLPQVNYLFFKDILLNQEKTRKKKKKKKGITVSVWENLTSRQLKPIKHMIIKLSNKG